MQNMQLMNDLRRIDLNLLVILDALLSEQHVTRAAERLRIRRTTLVEKMRKYGMSRKEGDEQADD